MAWKSPEISGAKLVFLRNGDEEYELDDLLSSETEMLGKGTFGRSYKAKLENKNSMAVKRLWAKISSETAMEFKEKIGELGEMVHENLLPIRAYCCHQYERILVYDYMSMGSLALLLHGTGDGTKIHLTWEVRSRIAYGVAQGIAYIHSKGSKLCHGNIRSSNIFLTNFFDVRISEFGISQLVSPDSKFKLIEGYRAPEVMSPDEVSHKSDVYSFGVLLLELLTGKAPLGVLQAAEGVDLPKWIRSMFLEKPIIDVFDNELVKYDQNNGEKMVQLLQLAVCCTFENPSKRPAMFAVTNRIKHACRLVD